MKVSGKILLFILILSGFSASRCVAAVYYSDGSVRSVQALHNAAHDGDTIVIPAGIFSWTVRLNITKGVTIQGATTISGAGTANPVINDGTIVQDNTPRDGAGDCIISVTIPSSKSFRLTGITFSVGSTTVNNGSGAIRLVSTGSAPCTSVRVDHCHFEQALHQGKIFWVDGWIYGVADHNVIECDPKTQPFYVTHPTWGGSGQIYGNGSWADCPWYGTGRFWFIEDNTVIRNNAFAVTSLVDCEYGGRWVARHNYLLNAIPSGHGTEGVGAIRGQRANEFYDNTINLTVACPGGGQRSGTSLWHDNVFIGNEPTGICNLVNFRETFTRPHPVWGIADGTSAWDQNDTEGNGTYIEGHPPYLFESGSATSGTTIVADQATFTDTTKNWTTNQWVGYSIRNTNASSSSNTLASFITSNTSNTITYKYSPGNSGVLPDTLIWNPGDTYDIHRVLTMMDQNGRGRGNQVMRTPPINSISGTPFWTHEALEPCYSWNNVHTPTNHALGFRVPTAQPTTKEGLDFFNLHGGFPRDTTPAAVSLTYTAALNGVNYTGTFVYPHPLVTAQPTSTQCSLLQRRLDRLERRQQRLEQRHRSNPRLSKRIRRLQGRLQSQHCP
jgi:hypothetical protein